MRVSTASRYLGYAPAFCSTSVYAFSPDTALAPEYSGGCDVQYLSFGRPFVMSHSGRESAVRLGPRLLLTNILLPLGNASLPADEKIGAELHSLSGPHL